jgi:hypothetical protein
MKEGTGGPSQICKVRSGKESKRKFNNWTLFLFPFLKFTEKTADRLDDKRMD